MARIDDEFTGIDLVCILGGSVSHFNDCICLAIGIFVLVNFRDEGRSLFGARAWYFVMRKTAIDNVPSLRRRPPPCHQKRDWLVSFFQRLGILGWCFRIAFSCSGVSDG